MDSLRRALRRLPLVGRYVPERVIKPKNRLVTNRDRAKLLGWATLAALLLVVTGWNEPFEDFFEQARDWLRLHKEPVPFVVVGIDDKTASALGGISYSRKYDAQAIDNLFRLGAKRVIYDRIFGWATDPESDNALAAALARHPGKVYFSAYKIVDEDTGQIRQLTPYPLFQKNARISSITSYNTPISDMQPYKQIIYGKQIPSMSVVLANYIGGNQDYYRPDYSFDSRSIQALSFIELINGERLYQDIKGKDVIIAPSSTTSHDYSFILSQGNIPGVYCLITGALTLRHGTPMNFGYLPTLLLSLFGCLVLLYGTRKTVRLSAIVFMLVSLVILPLIADYYLVTIEIAPAVFLFSIVAVRAGLMRKSQTNKISRLPNLLALQSIPRRKNALLVAMHINHYARINASFNSNIEHELLSEIARRIRINGDKQELYHHENMLFWLASQKDLEELVQHLAGLSKITDKSIIINGRHLDLLIAFGVGIDDGLPLESRIKFVGLAAQQAADENQLVKVYSSETHDTAEWDLALLSNIDHALDNGEIWVAYQPKLDLMSNQITGAEALVRWSHPIRGLINPDQFIGALEEQGRIEKLTQFVLKDALKTAAERIRIDPSFSISVNIAASLLTSPVLLPMITDALKNAAYPANNLYLEITETGRVIDVEAAQTSVIALHALGVHISIDDYGTGNATLEYVKNFPADEIKIDRKFIATLMSSIDDLIMVKSTIEMAHKLNFKVVAEGVEYVQCLDTLARLGCDIAQGYYIAKPMPARALHQFLATTSVEIAA